MEKDERIYQLWELVIYFAMILTGLTLLFFALGFKVALGIGLILLAEKM